MNELIIVYMNSLPVPLLPLVILYSDTPILSF